MKRLVVCFDGTWNDPQQEDNGVPAPTNVFKLHNAVAERAADGSEQRRYYHPGVGSEGGAIGAVLGGALGVGLSRHVQSAYHWLGQNYEKGDQIYLFGFSRGAFTVRSIAGLLGRGLLDLQGLEPREAWRRVKAAYERGYRRKGSSNRDRSWARDDWKFFHGKSPTPVHFLGVWDTVGALGVPDDLELLNLLDNGDKWRFHDSALGRNVKTARHAMAIDEIRSSFTVTRWSNAAKHPDAKEVWFPGVHSDVGGGYAETDLSNGALRWMLEEAATAGLSVREGVTTALPANPRGVMHNSFKGAFAKLRSRPRNVDALVPENAQRFHPSAIERQHASPIAYPAYRPTRVLEVGETASVDVFADTRWNDTGVYLPGGHRFVFSATGEWQDSKDTCDWTGTDDGKLTMGDVVRGASSFLGRLEDVFEAATGNESTDFLLTKRVEELPWFVLVGAIANDSGATANVENDGSPVPHQQVALPEHTEDKQPLAVEKGGYLFCFPNDVWGLYGNNHGSVRLTVTRVG